MFDIVLNFSTLYPGPPVLPGEQRGDGAVEGRIGASSAWYSGSPDFRDQLELLDWVDPLETLVGWDESEGEYRTLSVMERPIQVQNRPLELFNGI